MVPFVCPRSKTIPLAPIHLFTKQIVLSMYQELLSWSRLISKIFKAPVVFFFHFHRTLSLWACGSWHEPRKFFSFCAFTCLSNNSLRLEENTHLHICTTVVHVMCIIYYTCKVMCVCIACGKVCM